MCRAEEQKGHHHAKSYPAYLAACAPPYFRLAMAEGRWRYLHTQQDSRARERGSDREALRPPPQGGSASKGGCRRSRSRFTSCAKASEGARVATLTTRGRAGLGVILFVIPFVVNRG